MPAEDADATRALLSETLFAEQLHGRSYYYHEKSGASQFDKPKAPREPDSEDDVSIDEPYDIEPYDTAQQAWRRRDRNARSRSPRRWRRRQERLLNI